MKYILLFMLIYGALGDENGGKYYRPVWDDLDTHPIPEWYQRAKIGIFIHWGVYSVPALINTKKAIDSPLGSEWFWELYMKEQKTNQTEAYNEVREYLDTEYRPGFTYQEFATMFRAELFNPSDWAELFARSGAKYVILTTKHHDGFTLFPSNHSYCWNSMEIGPHRDLVNDVATAVRERGLQFGVYYSLLEWNHPYYLNDVKNSYLTHKYRDEKMIPELKQLVHTYRPSMIWADGSWASPEYFDSQHFLAWLYNDSPVKDFVVVNDRWGKKGHGDYKSILYPIYEELDRKFECACKLDKPSWGYRKNMGLGSFMSLSELLQVLVTTVAFGGNLLINIGPSKEGTIDLMFQERLIELGDWLKVNGEAIYDTSPWYQQVEGDIHVFFVCKKTQLNLTHPVAKPNKNDKITAVYAFITRWPDNDFIMTKHMRPYIHEKTQIELLGYDGKLENTEMCTVCYGNILVPKKNVTVCVGELKYYPRAEIKIGKTVLNSSSEDILYDPDLLLFVVENHAFKDPVTGESEVMIINGNLTTNVVLTKTVGVHLPRKHMVESKHVWVLKFTNLK